MFLTEYTLFGNTLTGLIVPVSGKPIALEDEYYVKIKHVAERLDWNYYRLETVGKDGVPDILVTRADEYWFIEVKRLKKKKLKTIQDDLQWQFGQLAFMTRCFRNKTHYILAVVKDNTALYLKEKSDETSDYPDFVKLF